MSHDVLRDVGSGADEERAALPMGRSIVVAIGIDAYRHGFPVLANARQDAQTVVNLLKECCGFEELPEAASLFDEAATREAIESLVLERLGTLQGSDRLVLFFAGHGAKTEVDVPDPADAAQTIKRRTGYLIPVDARPDKPSGWIRLDSFLEGVASLPARHIFVILDACKSGMALADKFRVRGSEEPASVAELNQRVSRRVMTSAMHDQKAQDGGSGTGDSLFVEALVEAVRNRRVEKDGYIKSTDLFSFVQDTVNTRAQRLYGAVQTPDYGTLPGDGSGDLVLSLKEGAFERLVEQAYAAMLLHDAKRLEELLLELVAANPDYPMTLYLLHRLRFMQGDLAGALGYIARLQQLQYDEGSIPLRKEELPGIAINLNWLKRLLSVPSGAPPIEVKMLTGPDREDLSVAPIMAYPWGSAYQVEDGAMAQFVVRNLSDAPAHLYQVVVTPEGRYRIGPFPSADAPAQGLAPGESQVGRLFQVHRAPHSVTEVRVLYSPVRVPELAIPFNTAECGQDSLGSAAIDQMIMAPLWYIVTPLEEDAQALAEAERQRAAAEARRAQEVQAEHERADQQARRALSGQLAAQAQSALDTTPERSLLLAAEALSLTARFREPRVAAAEQALRDALETVGGRGLAAHEGPVNAIAFSPNGRWLATAGDDATVRLWNLSAANPAAAATVLRGHEASIHTLAFSADSRWLVSGCYDDTARLWDLSGQDPPATAPLVVRDPEGHVTAVALSPDARRLVTGGGHNVARLWDLTGRHPRAEPSALRVDESGSVVAVAFSPDGRWLATGHSLLGQARLWDLTASDPAAGPVLLRGHSQEVSVVAFSPDGRWLATGGGDNFTALWDMRSRHPAAARTVLRGHEGKIYAAAFSPDGRWLATGSGDATARVWDLTAGHPDAAAIVLWGHTSPIRAVAFSSDGCRLATGSQDKTARLWDLRGAQPAAEPAVLRGHEGEVRTVAFSPDGRWLATAGADGIARLWDPTNPDPPKAALSLAHPGGVISVAFSPNGGQLATGGDDDTVRLWDLASPDPAAAAPTILSGHKNSVHAVAFSRDGRWLATGSHDETVRLWDLSARGLGATAPTMLSVQGVSRGAIAFSPDSHRLAVTGISTVQLLDLTSADPSAASTLSHDHGRWVGAVAFSPDGRWLATGSQDQTARLWDLAAAHPAAACTVLRGHGKEVTSVAFSPDGRWLATGSADNAARLFDLAAGEPAAACTVLRGHGKEVASVAFSPDGRWLATGSEDHTARLWDLAASDTAAASLVLSGHTAPVKTLAFSADGRWLATCDRWPFPLGREDKTARLWDLTAPSPSASAVVLGLQRGQVGDVAFCPDGCWLATASDDGTARLWFLRPEDLIHMAGLAAGRNLSLAEWNEFVGADVPYHCTFPDLPPGPGAPGNACR